MHPIIRRTTTVGTALIAAGLLAACASRGPLSTVDDARAAVDRAAANPAVTQYAPLELKAATDTLARADRVWRENNDAAEANHLAYLATQRAEIANNTARARMLDADVKKAGTESERLRLTREAERARMQADANARTAQQAQLQAMTAEQRAAQSAARVRALESQLRDIQAQQTERGLLVTLGDVLFAFNKAELSDQAAPRLDKLADFLRQFPDRKLIIEGYTDSVGRESYNQSLSERRAMAVQRALVQRGVTPDRITARGYGKAYPVADNASAEGRAMNRRVEIVITDDQGKLRGR